MHHHTGSQLHSLYPINLCPLKITRAKKVLKLTEAPQLKGAPWGGLVLI